MTDKIQVTIDGKALKFSRDEESLLLYLESCAVDQSGRVDQRRMNDSDRALLSEWSGTGFVMSGRICFADATRMGYAAWVRLSDKAWKCVGELRRARAERLWGKKSYKTTLELSDAEE